MQSLYPDQMITNRVGKDIRANFRNARVLVIEDNPDQLRLTEAAIQRCLPEVITLQATTQEQALTCLKQCTAEEGDIPKLILLDLYLPYRTDGWDLLQKIRNMPLPFNRIPVVILSASADPADVTHSYQQGGTSYLVKPLIFDEWIKLFTLIRTYWWETVILPDASTY